MWFLQVGRCPQSKLKAAGKIMLYLPQNRPGNRKASTVRYWIQNKSSYHRYNFNLVFYTGKFWPLPPFPPFFFILPIFFFCLSLRIPHETVIFIMLQYLSSGKSLLALPRTRVRFSASVCSLAMCVSYPVNDTLTSVTAMLRADATKANYFSMYCNHAQTLKYEVTSSNVEELGTRLRHAPCFWALAGSCYLIKMRLCCFSPPACSHRLTVMKWSIT